jgi:cation diffusion facilitator family transporter
MFKMKADKKATLVSSSTSVLLIFIKLVIGVMSGSVAVLASAIDSVLDLIVSLFNFFAISKADEKEDEKFNYGKGKIEALAAVIEGTVITISGLYIIYSAVMKYIHHERVELLTASIVAMSISLVITIALVLYLNRVAKETNSLVIRSDALHYKTDIWSNIAILTSLVLVKLSGLDFIDSIVGAIIGFYIIYSAYEIIAEGVYILLDGALDKELVEKIKRVLMSEGSVTSYHFLKTRHSANTNFVDVHLVFTPEISLLEAHRASDRIEERIRELDKENRWEINIHLDPYDDSDINNPEGEPHHH